MPRLGGIVGFPLCSHLSNDVLNNAGIKYSSSVLPAKNPLYGWGGFGFTPKKMPNGIIEIPITVDKFGPLTVPFAGGIYF